MYWPRNSQVNSGAEQATLRLKSLVSGSRHPAGAIRPAFTHTATIAIILTRIEQPA